MKILMTLEDTPKGVHVEFQSSGGGADSNSLALLLACNLSLYMNDLRLRTGLKTSGNVFTTDPKKNNKTNKRET